MLQQFLKCSVSRKPQQCLYQQNKKWGSSGLFPSFSLFHRGVVSLFQLKVVLLCSLSYFHATFLHQFKVAAGTPRGPSLACLTFAEPNNSRQILAMSDWLSYFILLLWLATCLRYSSLAARCAHSASELRRVKVGNLAWPRQREVSWLDVLFNLIVFITYAVSCS